MKHYLIALLFLSSTAHAATCKLTGSYFLVLAGGWVSYGKFEAESLEACVARAKTHLGEMVQDQYVRAAIDKVSFVYDDRVNEVRGAVKVSPRSGRTGD